MRKAVHSGGYYVESGDADGGPELTGFPCNLAGTRDSKDFTRTYTLPLEGTHLPPCAALVVHGHYRHRY